MHDFSLQVHLYITEMNDGNEYIIQIDNIDSNVRTYNLHADDAFYTSHNDDIIKGGNVDVKVSICKKAGAVMLDIELSGTVRVVCDKCLDEFDRDIEIADTLVANYGDETNFDTGEETITLERDVKELDVSQLIYEYSHYALPIANYHPEDEDGNSMCNKEMLERLNDYKPENAIDPRWEALQKLKDNSNNN